MTDELTLGLGLTRTELLEIIQIAEDEIFFLDHAQMPVNQLSLLPSAKERLQRMQLRFGQNKMNVLLPVSGSVKPIKPSK
jgi:hypothetical protein